MIGRCDRHFLKPDQTVRDIVYFGCISRNFTGSRLAALRRVEGESYSIAGMVTNRA